MGRRLAPVVLGLVLCGGVASADTIVLVDGRTLEAERAWYEGTEVRCRRNGTVFRLPRTAVARIDPAPDTGELLTPEVERSRERLAAGDASEALRFARIAVFRDPGSAAATDALAGAQLALGNRDGARDSAEAAVRIAPERASAHEMLADVLAAQGEVDSARDRYRLALELSDEPRLRRKIEALGPGSALVSSARFRVRYRGDADEALGFAILQVLDRSWDEYERYLGFAPDLPITVVLQTDAAFRDTTRAPEWAAAWNDGAIRLPVRGLGTATPGLVRVLRHELAHSFLTSRLGPECPTWTQEGVAQWLEGGDPAREDTALASAARSGRLRGLRELEAPFSGLSTSEATSAYAQSLSVVAHLLRIGGRAGLRRLLGSLAAGQAPAQALVAAYGLDYDQLQASWEAHLAESERGTGSRSRAGGR